MRFRTAGTAAVSGIFQTDDPDAFAASLQGGSFEYLPLPGAAFRGTLRLLQLADVVVQQAADGPHITRATLQPGTAALILPLRYPGGLPSANGVDLRRWDALLVPGGVEFYVACPAAHDWAAVALPLDLLAEWAEWAPPPVRVPGAVSILGLLPDRAARLGAALSASAELAERMPEALAEPGCAEGLAMSLRELIEANLTADVDVQPQSRATREALRVVHDAEAYLRAHVERPIHRDELCKVLCVSQRKLHGAFKAIVGVSPSAYLKTRRLVLARRALQAGDGAQALVKSVALSHGFWHLGYFARDYRGLFGEFPSQTLAAAGRSPADAGRKAASHRPR